MLRRDGGSRAGTPFAEDEATDGSVLDVAQLQSLLSDPGGQDRAPLLRTPLGFNLYPYMSEVRFDGGSGKHSVSSVEVCG